MEFNESALIKCTEDVLQDSRSEPGAPMTLHCQQCNMVVADSTGICGEVTSMDSIMCSRVTSDVVINDSLESGQGEMSNCISSSLKCGSCRCTLGRVVHSAPSHLAVFRSLFLLYKANISCYVLNSSSMMTASTLTFDLKPLRQSMDEVRQQFETQFDRMSSIKSQLLNRSLLDK